MTKTPEELTEDWKAGELVQDKDYYVETMASDIVIDFYGQLYDDSHYPQNLGFDNVSNGFVKRILAPVPTYDEYKAMQDQIANLSKEVEGLEEKFTEHKENCCCLENEKLQLDNNKLQEELANLKKWEKHTWDYDLQAERISELLTDNKKMQEQVVCLNKYIEQWQKAYQNTVTENCSVQNECAELLALLRECKTWMSWAYAELYEYNPEHESKNTEDLLTRINAALGCNETQANSVADIKIQESEEK